MKYYGNTSTTGALIVIDTQSYVGLCGTGYSSFKQETLESLTILSPLRGPKMNGIPAMFIRSSRKGNRKPRIFSGAYITISRNFQPKTCARKKSLKPAGCRRGLSNNIYYRRWEISIARPKTDLQKKICRGFSGKHLQSSGIGRRLIVQRAEPPKLFTSPDQIFRRGKRVWLFL